MNEPKFDEIAKLYYQSIYNYCRVRLGDDYVAQDCTQETFLVLYRKTDKLDFTDNIRAWLYRTADNIMKNYRKSVSESVSFDSETVMNITAEDTYCEDEPFEKLLTAEEVGILSAHYIDGFDIKTLSDRSGRSAEAIYKQFQRLKVKILKYIQNEKD